MKGASSLWPVTRRILSAVTRWYHPSPSEHTAGESI